MEHTQTPVPEDKKDALTKTFAIVGFTALLIFIVWLAVQLVSLIPSAFSSLASLADSVYNYDVNQELEVATNNSVVNAGETFTISWTKLQGVGSYAFTYVCTEGVSIDAKNVEGDIVTLPCDTQLQLQDALALEVKVSSEKHRFVDVPYTIAFTKAGSDEATLATDKTVTIVNASVPTGGSVVIIDDEDDVVIAKPEVAVTPKPVATPVVTKPVTTVPKVTYAVPVSNPNGKIDLQVTFIGSGTLSGKTFTSSKTIDADKQGAIQFEVKNIGTKTADAWSYKANLPADIAYTSGNQRALKPNERAIITLGFDGLSKTGTEKIGVDVTAKNDVKSSNNEFDASVRITD